MTRGVMGRSIALTPESPAIHAGIEAKLAARDQPGAPVICAESCHFSRSRQPPHRDGTNAGSGRAAAVQADACSIRK